MASVPPCTGVPAAGVELADPVPVDVVALPPQADSRQLTSVAATTAPRALPGAAFRPLDFIPAPCSLSRRSLTPNVKQR
jgi:hypothetical protein